MIKYYKYTIILYNNKMQFSRGKVKMFEKKREKIGETDIIRVKVSPSYSISDTFECGQCFRAEKTKDDDGYIEYVTVVGNTILRVGQYEPGEVVIYGLSDEEFEKIALPYLSLDTDYEVIKEKIKSRTDSQWLKQACDAGAGIAILRQDGWEALFSFIISQNNNIPRIKKIIKRICSLYGVNICLQSSVKKCPFNKIDSAPCEEICKDCGACYTFPSPADILKNPELLLLSNPGFRYKYLLDAAEKVYSGEVNLAQIKEKRSYEYTMENLKKIKGVGDKVASCTALFGFENYEAFPIDVWMKRAIDTYFAGSLDYASLGEYAGIAQQYIFHYIRNIEN